MVATDLPHPAVSLPPDKSPLARFRDRTINLQLRPASSPKVLRLSQSAPHPHDISNLIEPALIEIVHAVSDRPGPGHGGVSGQSRCRLGSPGIVSAARRGRPAAIRPAHCVQRGVRRRRGNGLLRGMDDTSKKQTMSSLVSMGRVTQGHVDRLAKRGNQPYLSVVAAPSQRPAEARRPAHRRGQARGRRHRRSRHRSPCCPAGRRRQPPHRRPWRPRPPPRRPGARARASADLHPRRRTPAEQRAKPPPDDAPSPEISWLDEPYQEYVIETPGLLLAREQMAQTAAIFALAEAALRDTDATAPQPAALPDPKAS